MAELETLILNCYWCQHTDKYRVGKFDQPKCKKCFRFVPKKQKWFVKQK